MNLDRYIFESESNRTEWLKRQGYKTPHSNIYNVNLSEDEHGYYVDCGVNVRSINYYKKDKSYSPYSKYGY